MAEEHEHHQGSSENDRNSSDCSSKLSLSFRRRLETKPFCKKSQVRQDVREELVKGYSQIHKAIEALRQILRDDDRVAHNPVLRQSLQGQADSLSHQLWELLNTPNELLTNFECRLLELVRYQVQHQRKDLESIPEDHSLNLWLKKQRQQLLPALAAGQEPRKEQREESNQHHRSVACPIETNKLFQQLDVKWRKRCKNGSYEEHVEILRDFKKQFGHLKVKRLYKTDDGVPLGEWIAKIRREYDNLQSGKPAFNLTPERVEELTNMGMIWRVRHGRPRKGDARFRLAGPREGDARFRPNAKSKKKKKNDQKSGSVSEEGNPPLPGRQLEEGEEEDAGEEDEDLPKSIPHHEVEVDI